MVVYLKKNESKCTFEIIILVVFSLLCILLQWFEFTCKYKVVMFSNAYHRLFIHDMYQKNVIKSIDVNNKRPLYGKSVSIK